MPSVRALLDTATALTFLLTELVELSTLVDLDAPIAVRVTRLGKVGRLTVQSPALRHGDDFEELVNERYGRIMNGLVRQLRTTLDHDGETGTYVIEFAVLPTD